MNVILVAGGLNTRFEEKGGTGSIGVSTRGDQFGPYHFIVVTRNGLCFEKESPDGYYQLRPCAEVGGWLTSYGPFKYYSLKTQKK